MTTVASIIPTGKRNMLASLALYLRTVLAPLDVVEEQYHQVKKFPSLSMQDSGLFGLGETSFDRKIRQAVGMVNYRGKIEQTQVEFNAMAMLTGTTRSAEPDVRNIRDRLKYALEYAGDDSSGLPAIEILRFNANPPTGTGFYLWHPSEVSAAWNEAFIANDEIQPGVKRYRIYARIYWQEMQQI